MLTHLTRSISILYVLALCTVMVAPVANAQPVPDSVTILEGETIDIDVLANDGGESKGLGSEFVQPLHGTVERVDGMARYTSTSLPPDGVDTFGYDMIWSNLLSGGSQGTGSATVTVNVKNVAPVVQDAFIATNEGIAQEIQIEIEHPTVANVEFTSRIVTPPGNGAAEFTNLNTILYTPNPGFSGTDTIEFVVNDGTDDGNIGTVTVEVVKTLEHFTVLEDADDTVIDLSEYYVLAYGDEPVTYSIQNKSGTATTESIEGSLLTVSYNPNAHGTVLLQLKANTASGASESYIVEITIDPVEELPVLVNPLPDRTVDEDAPAMVIDLSQNFADVDTSDPLTYTVSSTGPIGTSISGSELTITFDENQYGQASVSVTATDSADESISDDFTITINPVNDPPVLVAPLEDFDVYDGAPPTVIDLAPVFADVDGDTLTYTIRMFRGEEIVTLDIQDSFLTIDYEFVEFGEVFFSINAFDGQKQVSDGLRISVFSNNAPELIQEFPDRTVAENTDEITNLNLRNYFRDNDKITYTVETLGNNPDIVTTELSGELLSIAYVSGRVGDAVIRVTATDDKGKSNSDEFTITVKNFAPDLVSALPSVTVEENASDTTIDLSNYFADANGDEFTFSIETLGNNPNTITATLVDSILTISYKFGRFGNAKIQVTATDVHGNANSGDINITINSNGMFDIYEGDVQKTFELSQAFTGSFQGEIRSWEMTDALDTLILDELVFQKDQSQRYFTVSSPTEFSGDDSFTIRVRSRTGNAFTGYNFHNKNVVVPIRVHAVPEAPIANAMQIDTPFDTAVTFLLDGYDPDNADGTIVDPVSFSVDASTLTTGTLQLLDATTGEVQYTPASGLSGTESFTYTITGGEETASNTVTITVLNAVPVLSQALEDFTVDEDSEDTIIDLSQHFIDLNADDLLTFSASNTGPVTLTLIDELLTVSYDVNQSGEAIVDVTATDLDGDSASDSFIIAINPVNDAPQLVTTIPDYEEFEDAADYIFDVSPYFTDMDEGDTLLFSATRTNGPFQYSLDGSLLTISHNPDQSGQGYITVIATDAAGESVSDEFRIWVRFVNDAPTFQLDQTELSVLNNAGPQTLLDVISEVSPGPGNDSRNQVAFQVSTNAPELFAQVPAIDSTGVLTFEPLAEAEGTAEVSITLTDNGGTQDGGVDTSETQTLLIHIESEVTTLLVLDSNGNGIAGASAQYQSDGGWLDVPGVTNAQGELELDLPLNGRVKFRMIYENSTQTITQNLDENQVVLFQTVLTTLELIDSTGARITDEEAVFEFYNKGWQSFGSTQTGVHSREMLPNNFSFRVLYANTYFRIRQDIATNSTVTFQTVPVTISLVDSNETPISNDSEVFYRGIEWSPLGTLQSGTLTKELLPAAYRFRITHASATIEKRANVKFEPSVTFKTKKVDIELRDSAGALITDGTAQVEFHSSGWNELGVIDSGVVSVELLPKTYNFRITHKNTVKTKTQNIQFNPTVDFKTVKFTLELRNSESNLIADENGSVQFNSGGWNEIGETENGAVSIELLPNLYNFRMTYANASVNQKNDYFQDTVVFQTENIMVELRDSTDELFVDAVGSVEFNSGGWQPMGDLVQGQVSKELLPMIYNFRMKYANASVDKKNDGDDPLLVSFNTSNVTVQLIDSAGYLLEEEFSAEYNSGGWHSLGTSNTGSLSLEILPKTYNFRLEYQGRNVTQRADAITPDAFVDFITGQVTSLSGTAVEVNSGGWIPFEQNMELLPGNYSFRYADNSRTNYLLEAGVINEID